MKKLFILLTLAFSLFTTSCATLRTLADEIKNNPAAAVSYLGNVFSNASAAARAAFEIWAMANPDAAAQSRVQFNSITADVERGVRTGLSLAGVVTADNADARFDAARTAMTNLNAFLAGLHAAPGSATGPEMQDALAATLEASGAHAR